MPQLKVIAEHTGYDAITLIGAQYLPKSHGYNLGTVHYGTVDDTIPKDFPAAMPKEFRTMFCKTFTKFAREVSSTSTFL